MQTEIEAARALVWRAARLKDAGLPHTVEGAQAKLDALRARGFPEERIASALAGDPDTVGERAQALADAGIEGLTISIPDGYDPELVELAGRTIAPVFAASAV